MSWRAAYWVVFVATGIVYATMIFGTLSAISDGAAGLMPFDMRPMGYATADAQTFLDSLTDEARSLYLGPQRLLDTAFPALFGISLFGAFFVLVPHRGLRWGLIFVTVGAVAADYVENVRIARMLSHNGVLPTEIVSAASLATVTKSILNTIAMVSLFIAVGFAFSVKRRAR